MKIPYLKTSRGEIAPLNRIDGIKSDGITYCCMDINMQIHNDFIEIMWFDPPQLQFKDSNTVRIVRYCPNCGEKVITERVTNIPATCK